MDRTGIVVFSGGSAANTLVDVFGGVADQKKCPLTYIIPISDNGGSTSELIRFFGGPGIGDVRSQSLSLFAQARLLIPGLPLSVVQTPKVRRLVRLIPEEAPGSDGEKEAVKALFNHRLAASSEAARLEWLDIVEGRHSLWSRISSEKRELIRSFLNTINLEIVKRTRSSSIFNFQLASVGNLFLTGARIFTGSFESAIYLLGSITNVPSNVSVIPAINSNFSHHICAGLRNGDHIIGQNSISHPTAPTTVPSTADPLTPTTHRRNISKELLEHDRVEDANLPGSLPSLRKQYIDFQKGHVQDLPARIERIWYINPYGQEIRPHPNPKVLNALASAQCVIYSIGSLYTSIVPCLILKEVGEAINAAHVRFRVLILNGSIDRETGPSSLPFGAKDFVAAIANACASSRDPEPLIEERDWNNYVTHVIYLEGEGAPKVEKEELRLLGIETIRLYGRRNATGGMIYDGQGLGRALEAIMGSRDLRIDQSRRNTLQS
ncbi:MAG: hypothetical protein M1818_006878 [Claussenomyces sp. TS43310]|nr:MAG: hypothetical protein M1818_006878 [Claussenomyces sp. TS43310]